MKPLRAIALGDGRKMLFHPGVRGRVLNLTFTSPASRSGRSWCVKPGSWGSGLVPIRLVPAREEAVLSGDIE